jgi:hypothetical protein
MRWLAPGADPVAALGWQPSECLPAMRGGSPEAAQAVYVGRVAFRSPLLLGGQAARAGISCETCHRNGRDNPGFLFPGASGAPGTADVTSSLFSSHRGNGVDDPRPIPDLGGPRAALKVDHDPASRALETFIRGLITEEFDGRPPTAAVLTGLAAYVRALDPAACAALRPQTGSSDADQVRAMCDDVAARSAEVRRWAEGVVAADAKAAEALRAKARELAG